MATEIIKHCLVPNEEAKRIWSPRSTGCLTSKVQEFIKLSFLQHQASLRCQSHKGLGSFYKDCDKVLETYKKPNYVVPTDDFEALLMENKNQEMVPKIFPPNETESYTMGMTQWVCFILSSIASLPECRLIVRHINDALSNNKLDWYLKRQVMQDFPRQAQPLFGLGHILKDAIAFYKSEKVNDEIEHEYSLEVDRMIHRNAKTGVGNDYLIYMADKDGDVKWGNQTLHFDMKMIEAQNKYLDQFYKKDNLSPEELEIFRGIIKVLHSEHFRAKHILGRPSGED